MPKLADTVLTRARQVDLIAYLTRLGHQPASRQGTKALFHSPVRPDRHPSFSVSFVDGAWKWYDFGTGEHGDGIDLVQQLHGVRFQAAVHMLVGDPAPSTLPPSAPRRHARSATRRVRAIYAEACAAMTPARQAHLAAYFRARQLPLPPELGAVYLERHVDEAGTVLPFVAIPLPSATPALLRGLECRALADRDVPRAHRRRTLGAKTLWVWRRPSPSLLVTESILDCLAGDRLLEARLSLVALNGIRNVDLLLPCMRQLRPQTIYLALDNDPDPERGPAAQDAARHTLLAHGFHVVVVRQHVEAGVKDLQQLLSRHPRPLTVSDLGR